MTTNTLFEQAQLAQAAYADFWDESNQLLIDEDDIIAALKGEEENDFSEAQAEEFVKNWRIESHLPDTAGIGFSATVFERLNESGQGTGEFSLAIRGSTFDQLGIDFAADAALIATDGEGQGVRQLDS